MRACCARALALGTPSYTSVAAILNNRQDRKQTEADGSSLVHENIRGPGYTPSFREPERFACQSVRSGFC